MSACETAPTSSRPLASVAVQATAWVPAVMKLYRAWRNRRELRELAQFDAHMLKDIGLTHGDIAASLSLPSSSDPARHLQTLADERRTARRAMARAELTGLRHS